MRALRCLAATAMTLLQISGAQASPRNWIDRYIAAHGHCRQAPVGPFTVVNPLEKPIAEWTDGDLADLKAALDRCDALPDAESGVSRMWTGPLYESYVALVREQQERARRDEDARVAAREQAERADATRQRLIAADKQAAADRLSALRRAADDEVNKRKAAESRASAVADELKAAARLADETEARAKAAQAEAQARYGVEAAKRRAREAEEQAEQADEQAKAERQEAHRRFGEAHPDSYTPAPSQNQPSSSPTRETREQAATTPATTNTNYVACKMLNGLITASQAIVKGNWEVGAALVNAGECIMIDKGTIVQVKVVDVDAPDPKVVCVQISGHASCLWVPTSILEPR